MTNSDQHLLDKLSFWHKLEFFIPFNLDDCANNKQNQKAFWRTSGDPTPIVFDMPPDGMEVARYSLFLGTFDKREIRNIAPPGDQATPDGAQFDEDERATLEGLTCMASLDLAADGSPLFDTFEISTLPWAIGQCRQRGLRSLSSEAFRTARTQLAQQIHNFNTSRPEASSNEDEDNAVPTVALAPDEVDTLIDLISKWSGFAPTEGNAAALLVVHFRKKHTNKPQGSHTQDEDASEAEDALPLEIGILNSFYMDDIERAMDLVRSGQTPDTLRKYLTPLAEDKRQDLYSERGRARIIEALRPQSMNEGRWSSDPVHAMSLMQQFAINSSFETCPGADLFSVNGPPGTGKTTLLRDIIAENVTRRASVLASLDRPADAFQKNTAGPVKHLIPELTGFEMVVASSNNAAVENISRDLPKRASVHDLDLKYLQPVAHNIAANIDGKTCKKLSESDLPWGLVAAAMGRKSNRYAFVQKLFFDNLPANGPKTWTGEQRPMTLWDWRNKTLPDADKQAHFEAARAAFQNARKAVAEILSQMDAFATVQRQISGHTAESWQAKAEQDVTSCKTALEKITNALAVEDRQLAKLTQDLADLVEDQELISRTKPVWWQTLLGLGDARQYRARCSQNAEAQMALRQDKRNLRSRMDEDLKPAAAKAQAALEKAQNRFRTAQQEWGDLQNAYASYLERFGNIAPPYDVSDIETDEVQRQGIWHTQELAQRRSDLFKRALELHEAWLLAVSQNGGGFGGNLSKLRDVLLNTYDGTDEELLALWQSVFMIVPVVSSTFASFARQFVGLGPGSLGWLFIDEAGQAVPQAAVGGLFRAKRAVVIGDPLQIEPVFTLPKQLIAELADLSNATRNGSYSPDRVSVQVLADQANPFGAQVQTEGDTRVWIGSPLRVHRRCIDPMFSIANSIAYEDRMVLGDPTRTEGPNTAPFMGPSCWIDLPGKVQGKQTVPEQVDFVAHLIAEHCTTLGTLPELYVISPFKEVKEKLSQRLRASDLVEQFGASQAQKKALRSWIKDRVGTVHTFQGKEEDTVIMLLGADDNKQGAAQWAASKPNILNVALTRAKRRFYMVGDRTLWGSLTYFSTAHHSLPPITPTEFAQNARTAWAEQAPEGQDMI